MRWRIDARSCVRYANVKFMVKPSIPWVILVQSVFGILACVHAEEFDLHPHSSLTVVNAVPGVNNVHVSFDGQSIWPPGFKSGQSTAAVMFPSGKKNVRIECEDYASTDVVIDLSPGANCAMVLYPGDVVSEGPDIGKRSLGIYMPQPHPSGTKKTTGKRWKIVLASSAQALQVEVNGQEMSLQPRQAAEVVANRGNIEVKHRGTTLLEAAPSESGEYWVVVFQGEEGLVAVLFDHSPFQIKL